MVRPAAMLLMAAVMSGCAMFDESFSRDIDRTYSPWIGKSKEDRIRTVGQPDRCAVLPSGEEVCTWTRYGLDMPGVRRIMLQDIPSWHHRVVYVFDEARVARAWHYSGTWGERTSGDQGESPPPDDGALLP